MPLPIMWLLLYGIMLSACTKPYSIGKTMSQMSGSDIDYDYIRTEARKNKVGEE